MLGLLAASAGCQQLTPEQALLHDAAEALALAREELELAREWGAPTTVGRSLRALGLIEGGSRGLELLEEQRELLEVADAGHRHALHNEVHARPAARIRLPALVVYVAVLNDGVDRDTELAMLDAAGAAHPIEVAPTFLGAHAVGRDPRAERRQRHVDRQRGAAHAPRPPWPVRR